MKIETERRNIHFEKEGKRMWDCEVPSKCPHCHEFIHPKYTYQGRDNKYSDDSNIPVLYQCTNPSCREHFVIALNLDINNMIAKIKPYTYQPKVNYDMPLEIDKVSASFKEIYSQSQIAESMGLTQVSGIGYRKSIEFLVKDYLKYLEIKTSADKDVDGIGLSQAINLIPAERIKNLALAAVWIGNDEAHYVKKFENHDVDDMKGFIHSLGYEVASEVSAREAKVFIDSKGSK